MVATILPLREPGPGWAGPRWGPIVAKDCPGAGPLATAAATADRIQMMRIGASMSEGPADGTAAPRGSTSTTPNGSRRGTRARAAGLDVDQLLRPGHGK